MVDWPIKAKTIALVAAGIGQFKEVLGHHAAGFVGPSQWEPGAAYVPDYGPSPQELVGRLGKFGREGGDYALAQAYASGLVARKCVEEAGTLDNGALREVAGRLDFTTFYGRFRLDPATGNQIGRSVLIVQWQDGEKVILWPKEMRRGDMIYPSHTLSRI
jgi:branched-chain amino acid transport system substrate-binding protein